MTKMQSMDTPLTREEFEYRFHLLRDQVKNGKFHYPSGMDIGIDKVRYLPNGRIDFLSVNEMARLNANMTNMMPQFDQEQLQTLIDNKNDEKKKKS